MFVVVAGVRRPAPLRLRYRLCHLALLCACTLLSASCGMAPGSGPFSNNSSKSGKQLVVSADLPEAQVGSTYNAVVAVRGGNGPYQFSVALGNLPPGLALDPATGRIFGAPQAAGMYLFSVRATDLPRSERGDRPFKLVVAEAVKAPDIKVTVTPDSASVESGATQQFSAIVRGAQNDNVTWSASLGTISSNGTFLAPTVESDQLATVTATSVADKSKKATVQVAIVTKEITNPGGFDGPAELPRVYVQSSLADTPAPGKTLTVKAEGDVQGALNKAACGDTILLQAGATFTDNLTLPAKSCDDKHWIIVRTSAPDSALPPEGTRLTPCYSGVTSLPGRPALHCNGSATVTAKILGTSTTGPLTFAAGANHFRFIGLEITRVPASQKVRIVYQLAQVADGVAADHIIFDRVWAHGTTHDETAHGVRLNGITYAAIVDSSFTDFHCISKVGTCTDSQAISGGNGDQPGGPFRIVNNFLEGAGQSILFGGGTGSIIPSDIEIRRNHLFKPMTWMQGQSGFVGGPTGKPFIVKNHFELKDAQRVLFEGNVLENSWGGFSQVGWGIVMTPRGSWAAVQDVTIRYNTISHVGAGMQLSATQHEENNNWVDSLAAQRWSIHDVVIDDVDGKKYDGSGNLFQIASSFTTRNLNNVTIEHVTGITDPAHGVFSVGGYAGNPQASRILVTNNLFLAGTYTAWSTGMQGACSASAQPVVLFSECWNQYVLTTNAFILPSSQSDASWPSGNRFPANVGDVRFSNFSNGKGGDYRLLSNSPLRNAGSDGKDLGADIDAVAAHVAGVN